jgi:DNA-binding transcriptional MerR regulator
VTKSPEAFRTISEVAEDLVLPQHVLRFWETRFSQIKPMKRGGGRRYYRPDDIELLRGIQHLLYDEGYTIKGVQRILKDNGNKYVIAIGRGEDVSALAAESQPAKTDASKSADESAAKGGKQAVDVKEIMEGGEKPAKGKGLFNRLVGKEAETVIPVDPLHLSIDDKKLLQSTLYDLLECKRLLDQAR